MKALKVSAILGLCGCSALAASYWAPMFRPGSVRGADLGAGFVALLGIVLCLAGIGTALWGVVATPGARLCCVISAVATASTAMLIYVVGVGAYV